MNFEDRYELGEQNRQLHLPDWQGKVSLMARIQTAPVEGYAHLAHTGSGSVVLAAHPRMRVMDIGAAYSCEYTAEDIQAEFPFLDLPEIHQAIAYYLEHRAKLDRELEQLKLYWKQYEVGQVQS